MFKISKDPKNIERDLRLARLGCYFLAAFMMWVVVDQWPLTECTKVSGLYGGMFTSICLLLGVKLYASVMAMLGIYLLYYAHSKELKSWVKRTYN